MVEVAKEIALKFDWSKRTVAEWRDLFARVHCSNWLQSMPFARAVRLMDQKVTRFCLIRNLQDEAVGVMAIQEIKLGPIHVLYLYRGPLWFKSNPPESYLSAFATLFNETFPRRILRIRRWLPEWRDSEVAQRILRAAGFRPRRETYETIILDLKSSEAELRARLKQKWRNALNKGEKSKVKVRVDWQCKSSDLFLTHYGQDMRDKKYRARGPKFVNEEINTAKIFKEAVIFWALCDGVPVAAVLVLMHGNSATYRVGWTTQDGRATNAHNVLLWHAVKALKEKGLSFFDLGGVEPSTAGGVTQFKRGLGGNKVELVGVFS